MDRMFIRSILALGLFTGVALASAAEPTFQTIASETGRFTVKMPGEPKEITKQLENGEEHTFAVLLPGPKVYRIEYVEIKDANFKDKDPQKVLIVYRSGFRAGKQFEGDRAITLGEDKIPGREYRLEAGEGVFVRERLFLSGNRIYVLHVVSTGDKDYLGSKEADRFFDSFQITR